MKKGRSEKIYQSFWNTSPLRGRIGSSISYEIAGRKALTIAYILQCIAHLMITKIWR
jgi:hypothetical protein